MYAVCEILSYSILVFAVELDGHLVELVIGLQRVQDGLSLRVGCCLPAKGFLLLVKGFNLNEKHKQ